MLDDSPNGNPRPPRDPAAAFAQYQPPSGAIEKALRRIRVRRNDVRTMNELFETVSSLMRGFATLFGSDKYSKGGRHE